MKNAKINIMSNNCIIGYSWLIVTFFIIEMLLSSCGTPNSVRSQYRKSKENNNISKKHVYLDRESETLVPLSTETTNFSNENDIASNDLKSGSSPKIRIASLREQMKIYSEEQSIIKDKISNIQNDISGIKTTLTEIKENINPPKSLQTAIAGDYDQNINSKEDVNKPVPKRPLTILSDEVNDSKSKPKNQVLSSTNVKKKKPISINSNIDQNDIKPKRKHQNSNEIKSNEKLEPIDNKNDQKSDIETALNMMKQKKYESAIIEFNKIALGSKSNQVITSCNYWIGESYYAQNQYEKATQFFQRVLKSTANFKKDNAQILLAECYTKIGKTDNAKLACQSLIDNYPKSIYVPKAKKLLQTL